MPLPSWIRRFFSTKHRSISKTRTYYRPRVEALEHRINPGGSGGGTGTHAPVTIDEIVQTLEDTPYTFQRGDFHFSDPNDNPPDNFAAVKVVSLPANGALKLNNADVAVDQDISVEDIDANLFKFLPADNENGNAYATWNFAVKDNSSVADTSATHSMTVDVTAVNDAPSFEASDPPAVDIGSDPVSISAWATINPGGGSDESGQTATYIVSNISNPDLFLVAPSIDANGTLSYTVSDELSGTSTFDLKVQDNGGTANGGCDTSPVLTFTIQGNPLNSRSVTSGNSAGNGTLRQAIQFGNDPNRGSTPFLITFSGVEFVDVRTSGFTLSKNFTIVGPEGGVNVFQGGLFGGYCLFTINPSSTTIIGNVSMTGIANATIMGNGGAIANGAI